MADNSSVALALRQPLLRDALRSLLENEGFTVVGTAAIPSEAVRIAVGCRPDVLLLDCADNRPACLDTLRELTTRAPSVRVLLYAGAGAIPPLPEAILAGARGVVFDDAPAELLFRAVRSVRRGEYWVGRDSVVDVLRYARQMNAGVQGQANGSGHANGNGHGSGQSNVHPRPADTLTTRELQVIRGIASGESNREMADRLGLSEATVKYYVTAVYDKLGVSNRAELAALAVTRRLTEDDPPAGAGGPAA